MLRFVTVFNNNLTKPSFYIKEFIVKSNLLILSKKIVSYTTYYILGKMILKRQKNPSMLNGWIYSSIKCM